MNTAFLDEYAELAVKTGINLQENQRLVINSPIECADFARRIAMAAFQAGAGDVTMSWGDEQFARIRYTFGRDEIFETFPAWRREMYMSEMEAGAAFVSIHAADPEIFKDVKPSRLKAAQQSSGMALLEYRQKLMNNENRWCVVSVPTEAWARKVFPDLSSKAAVDRLWEEIFRTVHITGKKRAASAWEEHIAFLGRAAAFMNEHAFVRLEYKNERGTDLSIELPEGHIWMGGAEIAGDQVPFCANLPTEEIYTMPKRDGVNGTVVATRPLHYQGNLIENFRLTFKDGKVTDFSAERGEAILRELLSTDDGSGYLGEVALVPVDSPIYASGILFYNTLFDENASCHLALGKAYPTCIKDGEKMGSVELLQHGVNDSLVHEDFMVGSEDLSIDGIMKDGRQIAVFRDGKYAF
ncbi:aminopeptidase [Selenomonas sp. TAMA-11512]|uniref:aminopeptidase n=1 Tax=Selenomonas sp. TAMA-11512 TaxID=3095337 RepID=UPI00308FFA07|nr:aminopeptidase [Selenomonas sp. TAMA-11512]